jgi:hypothetical protein
MKLQNSYNSRVTCVRSTSLGKALKVYTNLTISFIATPVRLHFCQVYTPISLVGAYG